MEPKEQDSAWDWRKRKPNNMWIVDNPSLDFFKWWCECLHPIIDLSKKELAVVASFLKQRYELSKVISDPAVLDSQLMSIEIKRKIMNETGTTLSHFYVLMNTLKKKKVITETGINPRLIPNRKPGDGNCFQYLLQFKFPEEK